MSRKPFVTIDPAVLEKIETARAEARRKLLHDFHARMTDDDLKRAELLREQLAAFPVFGFLRRFDMPEHRHDDVVDALDPREWLGINHYEP